MNQTSLTQNPAWAAIVAEASNWVALLHGPDRTPAAERGLRQWLSEDALHRKAFELSTEVWNEARASVKRGAKVHLILPGESTKQRSRRWIPLAAAAAVAIAVAAAALFHSQREGIATGVGERRILALEDGSQVYLNTDTKIVVDYDSHRRRIRLESGEALFEVARKPAWPFVVNAGDRDITALGTSFVVRRDARRLAVTLVEGKIAVSSAADPAISAVLAPGERVTYTVAAREPAVDRPELARLTAWQNGKINLDNLTLAEAVAEMNRYSPVRLEVQGEAASALRLSGIFRIGDSRNFANAVAGTHGLRLEDEGGRLVLSGTPRAAPGN